MSDTRLRAADLADEFRSISSDKRMEYVPAQVVHLLIAADMLDANDELLMRLNADHLVRQNMERENAKLRELVQDMAAEMRGLGIDFKRVGWCDYADRMRELGVDA